MRILLAVFPHFQNTSFIVPHLGNACLSAYLKKFLPHDQIKTIDLRLEIELSKLWTSKDLPQMTYTKMYVSDIYDLPIIANLIKNFLDNKNIEDLITPNAFVIRNWAIERGLYPEAIIEKITNLNHLALNYLQVFKDFDIIGISLYTSNMYLSILFAVLIRKFYPKTKIVFGGSQITQGETTRELLLKSGLADYLVIGEGEEPFLKIIEAIKANSSAENIIGVKTTLNIDKLDTFSQSSNLEELPIPDYDDINLQAFNPVAIPIYSNRGCPFRCNFCSEHSLFGNKFKRRSPEKVISDMKFLKGKYGINEFTISDSLINSSEKWLESFTEQLLNEKEKFLWGGYFRAEMKEDLIRDMKQSGLKSAILGVESFSQRTLDDMNKRKVNTETTDTIKFLVKNNVHAFVNIFVGYPSELEEDFNDTYKISQDLFDTFKKDGHHSFYHLTARNFQLRPFSNVYNDFNNFGLEVESWESYFNESFYPTELKNVFTKTLCSFKIKDIPLITIQHRLLTMKNLRNKINTYI